MLTAFEAQLYLHVLALMTSESKRKKQDNFRGAVNCALASMVVQLVQKVRDALTKASLIGPVRAVIQSYLSLNRVVVLFQELSQLSGGFCR